MNSAKGYNLYIELQLIRTAKSLVLSCNAFVERNVITYLIQILMMFLTIANPSFALFYIPGITGIFQYSKVAKFQTDLNKLHI